MIEQIPERFSWSATRHGMFVDCPRRYFYHYYLAGGLALDSTREQSREARRLKNMTSVPMWVGSRVHDAIEAMLKVARGGGEVDVEKFADDTLQQMRRDYVDSMKNRAAREDPRFVTRFSEHEHDHPVDDATWKRSVDEALEMIRRFAGLGYLERVRDLPATDTLALETLEQWFLERIPIWVKIDLAYREADGVVNIVDWKTGKVVREDNPLQLMGYAAYAAEAWSTPTDKLAVREIYLRNEDPEKACTIDEAGIDRARDKIRHSVMAMLELIEDRLRNRARVERFEAIPVDWKCRNCFFQKICPDAMV